MRALLIPAALLATIQAQAPPPPSTDIYLVSVTAGLPSMKGATPTPVSTVAGYDNQPFFTPDGSRLLFAANHDGKQTDIYAFDRTSGRVSQLTRTPENENSPTPLPAGIGPPDGFSVVQSEAVPPGQKGPIQRLWRFDATGANPQLILSDISPVGYHAWVDADRLGLFVLGQPNTLQLASVKTGKGDVAAEGIGRSLHRVPGTRMISFVHREPSGEFWIKQIDVDTKKLESLTQAVAGSPERDMTWMPDGKTILMSSGTKVYSWTRGASSWAEVFDAAPHGLGAVTRLAVSPKGDAVALVVSEPVKK
jgi:Tol biopolymer transport system component